MGLDVSAHRIDNVPHRLPLLRSRGIAYRGAWRIAFHEDQPDRTQRFLLTDEHPHGLSDAVRLPYADCSFDYAIASGVLAGGSPSPGYQAPTWDRNRPPRDRLRQHSHRRAPEGNLLGLHVDHADLAGVPAGL